MLLYVAREFESLLFEENTPPHFDVAILNSPICGSFINSADNSTSLLAQQDLEESSDTKVLAKEYNLGIDGSILSPCIDSAIEQIYNPDVVTSISDMSTSSQPNVTVHNKESSNIVIMDDIETAISWFLRPFCIFFFFCVPSF